MYFICFSFHVRVQLERRCFFYILTLGVQLNFINIWRTFLGGVRGAAAPSTPPAPPLHWVDVCEIKALGPKQASNTFLKWRPTLYKLKCFKVLIFPCARTISNLLLSISWFVVWICLIWKFNKLFWIQNTLFILLYIYIYIYNFTFFCFR